MGILFLAIFVGGIVCLLVGIIKKKKDLMFIGVGLVIAFVVFMYMLYQALGNM